MPVYVDPLCEWGGSATFKWKWSCHMYADTLEELHALAQSIGLKRAWFQNHSRLPHYDLNASRREAAIKRGALEASHRHMMKHLRWNRDKKLKEQQNVSQRP